MIKQTPLLSEIYYTKYTEVNDLQINLILDVSTLHLKTDSFLLQLKILNTNPPTVLLL